MRHRQDVDLAGDRAKFVHRASVRALPVYHEQLADRFLDHLVHQRGDILSRVGIAFGKPVLGLLLGRGDRGAARLLLVDLYSLVYFVGEVFLHPIVYFLNYRGRGKLCFRLADLGDDAVDEVHDLADRFVGELHGVD